MKTTKTAPPRQARARATREALVAAALTLFDRDGLGAVSVDQVVREAGVAKGTFYVHFRDRDTFLREIHRDFHDRLTRQITSVAERGAPGRERLWRGIVAYLDGCLAERGRKALLFDARAVSSLGEEVARRNAAMSALASRELAAAGYPSPGPTARLVVAMAAEVAYAELVRGRKDTGLREALRRMIA